MKEKKVRTFEEIMEGFDRIEKMQEENAKLQEENAKGFAELREQQEENAKKREKEWSEIKQMQEENAKGFAELRKQIGGINKSAGLIAEEQVYNFLERTMTFGGVHFDVIQQNVHSKRTLSNGKKIEAEYDVLMINDVSVCIVETKSRLRDDDIKELTQDKTAKFKQLFPMYAGHKLYLGIGAMSFEKGAKKEAKNLGIGILKPKGDFVEVYDSHLKVY